jgi:putative oxidoreductase
MIKASTAPYAALLLRVTLGIMFLAHVGLKIFVFTIPGFVGYFGTLGLPALVAYAVIALELLGACVSSWASMHPSSLCHWRSK